MMKKRQCISQNHNFCIERELALDRALAKCSFALAAAAFIVSVLWAYYR